MSSIGHKILSVGYTAVGCDYHSMARGAVISRHSLPLDVRQREVQRVHHEAHLAKALEVHAIDLVVDVGANEGQYGSLLRSLGYLGDIVSFEPISAAYESLCNRVESDERWHAFNLALGDSSGRLDLNTVDGSTLSSALEFTDLGREIFPEGEHKFEAQSVEMDRLCEVVKRRPDLFARDNWLLKTDTQGFDLQVLTGSDLRSSPIKLVQCELSVLPLYEGAASYAEVVNWLDSQGFIPLGFWPTFYHGSDMRIVEMDCLMARA
jgi:FkbM family methyltransferase